MRDYLTPSARRTLTLLAEPDAELTHCRGQWWIENDRQSPAAGKLLLQLCLIHCDYSGGKKDNYEVYTINEEGRQILKDPAYRPKIIDAFQEWIKRQEEERL